MSTYSDVSTYNPTQFDVKHHTPINMWPYWTVGDSDKIYLSQAAATAASIRGLYNYNLNLALPPGVDTNLLVDPYQKPQANMSDLIEARYNFLKDKSAPLENNLFTYSQYDNPNLYNNYVKQAIPEVLQGFQDERLTQHMDMRSMGLDMSNTENVLNDKLMKLQSQESITQAANQIRTRLADREMQISFGLGSGTGTATQTTQGV